MAHPLDRNHRKQTRESTSQGFGLAPTRQVGSAAPRTAIWIETEPSTLHPDWMASGGSPAPRTGYARAVSPARADGGLPSRHPERNPRRGNLVGGDRRIDTAGSSRMSAPGCVNLAQSSTCRPARRRHADRRDTRGIADRRVLARPSHPVTASPLPEGLVHMCYLTRGAGWGSFHLHL